MSVEPAKDWLPRLLAILVLATAMAALAFEIWNQTLQLRENLLIALDTCSFYECPEIRIVRRSLSSDTLHIQVPFKCHITNTSERHVLIMGWDIKDFWPDNLQQDKEVPRCVCEYYGSWTKHSERIELPVKLEAGESILFYVWLEVKSEGAPVREIMLCNPDLQLYDGLLSIEDIDCFTKKDSPDLCGNTGTIAIIPSYTFLEGANAIPLVFTVSTEKYAYSKAYVWLPLHFYLGYSTKTLFGRDVRDIYK